MKQKVINLASLLHQLQHMLLQRGGLSWSVVHLLCHSRSPLVMQAYPAAATSPLSSTLLGVALTAFLFLTVIGFRLRRTNIVESSMLSLFLAYNIWLCGFDQTSFSDPASS